MCSISGCKCTDEISSAKNKSSTHSEGSWVKSADDCSSPGISGSLGELRLMWFPPANRDAFVLLQMTTWMSSFLGDFLKTFMLFLRPSPKGKAWGHTLHPAGGKKKMQPNVTSYAANEKHKIMWYPARKHPYPTNSRKICIVFLVIVKVKALTAHRAPDNCCPLLLLQYQGLQLGGWAALCTQYGCAQLYLLSNVTWHPPYHGSSLPFCLCSLPCWSMP